MFLTKSIDDFWSQRNHKFNSREHGSFSAQLALFLLLFSTCICWDPMDISGISERNATGTTIMQGWVFALLSSYSGGVTCGFRAPQNSLGSWKEQCGDCAPACFKVPWNQLLMISFGSRNSYCYWTLILSRLSLSVFKWIMLEVP